MNWKFIKTNWFYFALCILLLCYAVRKYPHLNPFKFDSLPGKEKLSDGPSEVKKGAALLGFVPDESDKRKPIVPESSNQDAEAFLKRFAKVAVSERKKFGIPVSVILAAAYVNSTSGKSDAARVANNFFSLPCSEEWEGESVALEGKCIRSYESAWASFRDFSIYLSSQEWYGSLKKSAGKDWHQWVDKLGDEDVSNAGKMKKIIEQYALHELD
jgi:flagellum-specific peptidoglycan hydrolase FlgJ